MKDHLSKPEVIKSVNSHLLTLLPFQEEHEIDELPATDLLCSERFDVMSKYIYAKLTLLNVASDWRLQVYSDLQKIFGFKEGDGSGKNSRSDYLNKFDEILNSIKTDGFKKEMGFLPIGNNNILIDGSHRLAASLLFNRHVPVIKFDIEPARYDYGYFLKRGLAPEIADSMALEFCRICLNMVIAVVFPVAEGKDDEIQSILKDYGQIAYEKQIVFSELGRHNLIRQLYRNESWLGVDGDITPGLRHHVEKRFLNDLPVKFYFVICKDDSKIKEAKARVRALFDLQNDSIHVNDTHEETIRIAEQILTPNSVHFLNHAQPWMSKNFLGMFQEYQDEIEKQNLNKEMLCIDSGSVLAVYGLRDTNDLDYLHLGNEMALELNSQISDHNAELVYHGTAIGDILFDPGNYFYYNGVKFVSLRQLRKMKTRRNEAKDIKDILLIDSLDKSMTDLYKLSRELRFLAKKIYETLTHFQMWQLKELLPEFLHPIARAIYHAPFYIRETFGSFERQIKYKGFVLHYSKGTSLIYRIRAGKTYEPELTWKILETLKRQERPVFLDIGANIGLITLNVLASLPQTYVFAFEPGPHQHSMFEKTIISNKLEHKVFLFDQALGFEVGDAYFNVHNAKDASGDGFFDTGRAGKTVKIRVAVNTLDRWWINANKPHIDVVKIDAEGAEYWILLGAVSFLKECRPVIFLEISEDNLKMYPYSMEDIVKHLGKCEYELRTLNGALVESNQIREVAQSTQDFMAIHR
jgi:FkbM family methyltransferase